MLEIEAPTSLVSQPSYHPDDKLWQKELSQCIRDLPSLLNFIELSPHQLIDTLDVTAKSFEQQVAQNQFPLRVPRPYASRIKKNDPKDPLLLQVLPLPQENQPAPGFSTDPLGEAGFIKSKGLLQKYKGRVLVVAHSSCAVHCRYCFRRHFPYDSQHLPPQQWDELSKYLSKDLTLNEVILSGGDPLTLKNSQLRLLNPVLKENPHIQRLRIHTRFPIMIPSRIDQGFVQWATTLSIPLIMVLHINHPNEIDQSVTAATKRLNDAGVTLLNQSVLLKGINDSIDTQITLQEKLGAIKVMPYYLHLLDPVAGAEHFDTTLASAQKIMKALHRTLPGYLVPKLVREESGKISKTPIFSEPI